MVFTASCKKNEATSTDPIKADTVAKVVVTPTTGLGSWTLGASTFNTTYTTRIHASIGSNNAAVTGVTYMDSTPGTIAITNSVVLFFLTPLTSSGTYRVAAYPSNLTATQIAIQASYNYGYYSSTCADTMAKLRLPYHHYLQGGF